MVTDTKTLRKVGKFLRKIGFISFENEASVGEFRVVKIYSLVETSISYDIGIDVEFKGKIKNRAKGYNYTYGPEDYKWTSRLRRNQILRLKISDEILTFMKMFDLTSKYRRNEHRIKLNKIKWIE